MKRIVIYAAVALTMAAITVSAHPSSPARVVHDLARIEENLLRALNNSKSRSMQESAAQLVIQLETLVPGESLDAFTTPLVTIVNDEGAGTQTRLVAAIALDGLHSEVGNGVLSQLARSSDDRSLVQLCSALVARNEK